MSRKKQNISQIKYYCCWCLPSFSIPQFAQQSYYTLQNDGDYLRGWIIWIKNSTCTAQKLFESVYKKNNNSSTELPPHFRNNYMAYCAVRLFNEDAEYLTNLFITWKSWKSANQWSRIYLAGYFYARKMGKIDRIF